MEHLETFSKTYSQAPWRRQLQLIGLFLLFLVLAGLIAGIYLSVSAKAAGVGRDIQEKQRRIETLERENENLTSRLATILSFSEMEARARKIGFQSIQPDQIVYLHIPGYTNRHVVVLAPKTARQVVEAQMMPEEYTESLFVWLKRRMTADGFSLVKVMP